MTRAWQGSMLAAMFSLGEATVKRWVWRHREQGSVAPTPKTWRHAVHDCGR